MPLPPSSHLGIYGQFSLRLYNPEPMRCYRCQRFSHHKDDCRGPERCGVCSELHKTDICKNLHKEGNATKAKCPNCGDTHHAWNKRCPERVKRIQDFGSSQQPKTTTSRPQSTRPLVESQWYTPWQVKINEDTNQQQTKTPIPSSLSKNRVSNNWRTQSTTPQGNNNPIDQGSRTNIPAIASRTSQARMMIPTSLNAPVAGFSKDARTQPRVSSPTKQNVSTPAKKTQAVGKIIT
ncbi:uncharacterized protein [Procambarus clarkii]|uniref:uncharacterized protein n=1 Tax=Procambarus clarkii TaxID=6728 RepID=UPI0037423CDD